MKMERFYLNDETYFINDTIIQKFSWSWAFFLTNCCYMVSWNLVNRNATKEGSNCCTQVNVVAFGNGVGKLRQSICSCYFSMSVGNPFLAIVVSLELCVLYSFPGSQSPPGIRGLMSVLTLASLIYEPTRRSKPQNFMKIKGSGLLFKSPFHSSYPSCLFSKFPFSLFHVSM